MIKKAKNSIKDTENLISKAKQVKKIEKIDPEKIEETSIEPIIEAAVSQIKKEAKQKNIKIETDIRDCIIKGGPLLEDTIINILENSVKHSKSDKIEVKTKTKNQKCILTIKDNGKGIKNNLRTKIFKKGFSKGEKAGKGLGLYLAKKTIQRYGGTIKAKKTGKKGASFEITLNKSKK